MSKNVGYFYWGFLGDKKFNIKLKEVSTPDGNAFYSWSILKDLLDKNYNVFVPSDRDKYGYFKLKNELFSSFCSEARNDVYNKINKENYKNIKLDYFIIEWRWEIPGRNDLKTKNENPDLYQPDQELMIKIINHCNINKIPFVVFDLDYKLTIEDIKKYNIKYVIELGHKWKSYEEQLDNFKSATVQIPFDFNYINEFPIQSDNFSSDLIYIGNRYERDWCIDKYLPEGTVIHGNWLEPGHGDPQNEWPHLIFRKRVNASEIMEPYNTSVATILLAKKEYCEMGFMTARIIEAVYYGTVPFFISEYGNNTIYDYAGKFAQFLTVDSKEELESKINILKENVNMRKDIIQYLRKHLRFMDSKFFINDIEELIYG